MRFTLLMTVLGAWLTGGAFLDGWAHNNLDSTLETFFTPWHAVLYGGFAACAAALVATLLAGRRKGYAWRVALPEGYLLSLAGAVVFAGGGLFDLFWHETFGIEKNVEALLSPAHLLLAVGAALIVSGPLRAAWRAVDRPRGIAWASTLMSLLCTLAIVSFMLQFTHPVWTTAISARPVTALARDDSQGRSIMGAIFHLSVLTGGLLLLRRRFSPLPFGSATALIVGHTALMASLREQWDVLIPAAFAAVVVESLTLGDPHGTARTRLIAAALPFTFMGAYFALLHTSGQVWWTTHLWTGTPVVAGIAGYLLSFLIAPPPHPERRSQE